MNNLFHTEHTVHEFCVHRSGPSRTHV